MVEITVVIPEDALGGTIVSFDITISNDMAFEKMEYFTLVIVGAEDGVAISQDTLVIHIRDDDGIVLLPPS
jgi:hypothetical protein